MANAGASATSTQAENSDELFALSVAVAVSMCLAGTETASLARKLAPQLPSVVTIFSPRKIWPSPYPKLPQTELAKRWSRAPRRGRYGCNDNSEPDRERQPGNFTCCRNRNQKRN